MDQVLSKASGRLMGQPMFQILSNIKDMERAGADVVHFEIGDPDFDTPGCIKEALKQAIDEGWTHYSASVGDYDLREVGYRMPGMKLNVKISMMCVWG